MDGLRFGTFSIQRNGNHCPAEVVRNILRNGAAPTVKSEALLGQYVNAIYSSVDGDAHADQADSEDWLREIDKTTFRSSVDQFKTLHEAIHEVAASVVFDSTTGPADYSIDTEPFEDHFDEVNDHKFDSIRAFMIAEYPDIEFLSFPLERVYDLGLPRQAPEPIDHGPAQLN